MSLCQAIYFSGLLVCLSVCNKLNAADSLYLSTVTGKTLLWQTGRADFLHSPSGNADILKTSNDWNTLDSPPDRQVGGYFWLRLTLYNDTDKDLTIDLVANTSDSTLIFSENLTLEQTSGTFVKPNDWVFPEYPELLYVQVPANQSKRILVRLSSHRGILFGLEKIYLQPRYLTLKEVVDGYRIFSPRTEFNGFFLGAVIVMMIFFAFLYARMREKSLLFYSLYLLGAAGYALVVRTLPYSQLARVAYLDYELTYKLGEPIQYLFFAAYTWFGKHLLDIDQRYGALFKTLKGLAAALVIAGCTLLITNFVAFNYSFQQTAYVTIRLFLLPASVTLVIWVGFAVRSPVKWFFIAGSLFFISGGLIAFLMDPKSRHLFFGNTYINPIVAFKSGILLEGLCFALALGYKLKLIQSEKEKATRELIHQMELNRQLSITENERLEQMVKERTEEVLHKNQLIENQKQQQLKSDFEKQLANMEMQALRSQMNPHFIFNSLNSIRHQILTGQYENAATYLMRFAKLLRQILQNSREHVISLSEEIGLIKLYLQLEQLRFGDIFEYHIEVEPDLDTDSVMIPSMLLQPYVENALKHGIASSTRLPRKIDVKIYETEEGFCYQIEDNGIGRRAAELKNNGRERPGLGLKITHERIMLFNTNFNQKIEVSFEDLLDDEQKPTGTRVIISHLHRSLPNLNKTEL